MQISLEELVPRHTTNINFMSRIFPRRKIKPSLDDQNQYLSEKSQFLGHSWMLAVLER